MKPTIKNAIPDSPWPFSLRDLGKLKGEFTCGLSRVYLLFPELGLIDISHLRSLPRL
jgi:hypothetical protein